MFKDFGIVSFVPSSKVNDFVKYLKEGKLAGTRCRKCGAYYMPPRADCVQCYSGEVEWVEKSNIGTLITFTTIYSAPTGFEERVPYNLGIAEFEGGGRLLGVFDQTDRSPVIGMKVKVVPKAVNERLILALQPGD